MKEIMYDENTKMINGYPEIKKLGICSPYGEMTPFVWKGRLMRSELIDPSFGTKKSASEGVGIRDVETGKILSHFAKDSYFHSAFVDEDKVYVTGVSMESPDTIRIYESSDLINWSSRDLFTNPGWAYCNTQITKGPDGYVIILEAYKPEEYVGEKYTHFFAKSPDLVNWTHLDPTRYSLTTERYNGGPWIRYSDGYYYAIAVELLPCRVFSNSLLRSKDLENWEVGKYNPLLMPSNADKLYSEHICDFTPERLEQIKTAYNINNSDIDMCDWNGNVYMNYAGGNQLGNYWMCEAVVENTTVAEFLKSFFE